MHTKAARVGPYWDLYVEAWAGGGVPTLTPLPKSAVGVLARQSKPGQRRAWAGFGSGQQAQLSEGLGMGSVVRR